MVRFPKLSTAAAWNSIIRESVNQSHPQKVLLLFRQMKQNGLEPNNFTFPFLAKACAKLSNLKLSQTIHTHVVKSPFQSDIFVQTAILDMYVKCNQLGDAYNLFEKITMKDTASYNVMLMGFVQSGFLDKVLCLVHDMRFAGIQPDTITVMGLIQASLATKNLELVKSIHAFGIQIGIECDVSMANTWISAYSKCADLESAKSVFDRIDMGVRTVVSWNSMIAGYSNSNKFLDVLNVYKQMLSDGYRPDISTTLSVLSSCNEPNKLVQGMLIHCQGIQLGCDSDIFVINDLISMYSKCGDILSARFLFDGMHDRTCVSWTAMISGYAENGNLNEALELFHFMEAAGEKPDLVTVLSLISGCGHTGALDHGKWIHNYAFSNGLRDNTVVCNALIDMYAKCGNINNARELFYTLPVTTVVSWTSMIAGYALNGQYKEALDLFYLMLETGMKPNRLTFLAILQACTHAGLLEKGMEFFNKMTEVYYMNPGVDHYSCMVNLLGRKGKLEEAVELVKSMPMKPDAGIWGALLSACRIHHNMEIGEYAFSRLLELEPQVAVPYVEMANIYASQRRWDEVAALRTVMKFNKVKKFPGQSLVHVNGNPHVFTVEDSGHPEALFIHAMIGTLDLQLKEEHTTLKEVGDMIN
ncbi:putative tetratricopeptide-like helical domain-containing protein [Rosa chinensis]|uniref:Putative tetratricopeptide-like helical domain-containing protein n=2 Tax=Rosa chinensis TaxID=74649 RepID=A0A2P6RR66_ROSCH|nr:pentatricopeptide repeat-containing protein At4g19191, mitochondrial isoform X1 [Rosa chinensis]XP_024178031.1 pentatricopeptide repeat-containing protein At4g19191, mitochondrial isoform X1 [Rosa chinensis]PRQ48920.1 putative tetratricopeptide-like helical domain-containing protein [Rosa chinensis]